MGFITLTDGTVIHGSQLPVLNDKPYKWETIDNCQCSVMYTQCNDKGKSTTFYGTANCKCKNNLNK